MNTYKSPICSCIICHDEFSQKGIHTHFITKHTTEYKKISTGKGTQKFILRCSCIICKKETTTQSLKQHITRCDKTNTPKNHCIICSNLTNNNKFCSRSCSALFNNAARNNQPVIFPPKPKRTWKPREEKFPHTKISHCIVCSKFFPGKRKTCSNACLQKRFSDIGKQIAKINVRRSSDEIKLSNLIANIIPVLNNHILIDGWDTDIFIPSLNIAVMWNGPWHYKEMGIKGHSLKQVQNRDKIKINLFNDIGIIVLVFEDRHFNPEAAFDYIVANYIGSALENRTLLASD